MNAVRSLFLSLVLAAPLVLTACGNDSGSSDAGGSDTGGPADIVDASVADVATQEDAGAQPNCDPRRALPRPDLDPDEDKFALAMFHFNLQYVAGGLEYTDDDGVVHTMMPGSTDGWTNEAVEDWIIRETFAPIIDFYLERPDWMVNIELQAYMLEVIADRFPELLEKLRIVSERGQVELVSFHYSDQLFLAFPREDLVRSIDETKRIFEELCLPLSPVVFNQEGQAGEGRQDVLVHEGYGIGVFPKNLWRYQHGDDAPWPYYASRGGDLIVGPGGVDPDSGVEVAWLFFDDGELLAPTAELDPYFAMIAKYEPENLEAYAERIQEKVNDGYRIAHVSDYVRHLKAREVAQPPAPPLVDGTWQPQSTTSIHRWLGGRGEVWGLGERDNDVRTGNARARTEILFAQTLRDAVAAADGDTGAMDADLATAWRALWMAQVSDASGINPWAAEIHYGLSYNREATETARGVIDAAKSALGHDWVRIHTDTGEVVPLDEIRGMEPPPEVDAPLAVDVQSDGRQADIRWFGSHDPADERYELQLVFSAAEGEAGDGEDHRHIEVAFPRTEDRLRYSPGLLDGEVSDHPFDAFVWAEGEQWLPLGNGLVGLGDGWWVIKDLRAVHLAARVAPEDPTIRFRDMTAQPDEDHSWTFVVVHGDEEKALYEADRLNVHPWGYR